MTIDCALDIFLLSPSFLKPKDDKKAFEKSAKASLDLVLETLPV